MFIYILYVYYDHISEKEIALLSKVTEDIGASLILFDTKNNNKYFEFTGFLEMLDSLEIEEGVPARYIFMNSSFFKNHTVPLWIIQKAFSAFPYNNQECYGVLNKSFKNTLSIKWHMSTWFFMVDSNNAKQELQFIPNKFSTDDVFNLEEWSKVRSWLLSNKFWRGYPGLIDDDGLARKKCTISLEYLLTKMFHDKNFEIKNLGNNGYISFFLLMDKIIIKCRRFLYLLRC